MKVSELKSLPPKILIYGPPGCAKTALALTLGAECQYLDLDDNLDVAFGLRDNLQAQRLAVDVKQFLDTDPKKGTAFPKFKSYLYTVADECAKGRYPFKYLVEDSLTSLAAAAQRQIMANSGKIEDNPQIQHWGMILNEIENVVTTTRALPLTVFVLAHETTFVADDISKVQISIPGQKLPGKITRMFNEIWYLRIRSVGGGKSEFYIQTVPTSAITCRSGRGLQTGLVFGSVDKDGKPGVSVGMLDILKRLERKEAVAVSV